MNFFDSSFTCSKNMQDILFGRAISHGISAKLNYHTLEFAKRILAVFIMVTQVLSYYMNTQTYKILMYGDVTIHMARFIICCNLLNGQWSVPSLPIVSSSPFFCISAVTVVWGASAPLEPKLG